MYKKNVYKGFSQHGKCLYDKVKCKRLAIEFCPYVINRKFRSIAGVSTACQLILHLATFNISITFCPFFLSVSRQDLLEPLQAFNSQ